MAEEITQNCDEGNQPIKWLAMVAAQRYSLKTPRGRVRQRDGPKSPRGQFVPDGLQSPRRTAEHDDEDNPRHKFGESDFEDAFIDPHKLINEVRKAYTGQCLA